MYRYSRIVTGLAILAPDRNLSGQTRHGVRFGPHSKRLPLRHGTPGDACSCTSQVPAHGVQTYLVEAGPHSRQIMTTLVKVTVRRLSHTDLVGYTDSYAEHVGSGGDCSKELVHGNVQGAQQAVLQPRGQGLREGGQVDLTQPARYQALHAGLEVGGLACERDSRGTGGRVNITGRRGAV
jgi:hypothetical protein